MLQTHDVAEIDKKDEELVALALTDQNYFGHLVRRYQQKLFYYIRKISNFSPEETEDVLQEIFIKAYLNLNNFDQSLKFSSWIYRIAHNQTISTYRKQKARPQGIHWEKNDFFLDTVASDFDITSDLDIKFLREHIDVVLTQLDLKYREVLILKYLEQKSYEEMSHILQKPSGTIATLLNRSKKQFKKVMEKNMKGDEPKKRKKSKRSKLKKKSKQEKASKAILQKEPDDNKK